MSGLKNVSEAIERTAEILNAVSDRDTWVIPQSGGKDSRTVGQVTLALIADGKVRPPRRIVFYMADTLMEYDIFMRQAKDGLDELAERAAELGIEVVKFITHPIPQDDFFVRIVGRGLVPPTVNMRSCTDKLKIVPPRKVLRRLGFVDAPVFLGVRWGESERRDKVLSCTVGGECGPDFQYHRMMKSKASKARLVTPVIDWQTCAVWDWLTLFAPSYGFDNKKLAEVYGPDGDLRYGCWTCPLIFQDKTGMYLAKIHDETLLERIQWASAMFRPGGAAWKQENREKIQNQIGQWVDGRLSIPFTRRLYRWLNRRHLLTRWEREMIHAMWDWRENLPDVQRGIAPQELWETERPLRITEVAPRTAEMLTCSFMVDDQYHMNIRDDAQAVALHCPGAEYIGQTGLGMTMWSTVIGGVWDITALNGELVAP